jgi:hypothetical protein
MLSLVGTVKAALRRYADTYGQPPRPAARLAVLTYEHSVWTLQNGRPS